MALHNDKPDTVRLDAIARRVLAAAVDFERAEAEASKNHYGSGGAEKDGLLAIVKEYRQALVSEMIGPIEVPVFTVQSATTVQG
jgi:hypothetical protein